MYMFDDTDGIPEMEEDIRLAFLRRAEVVDVGEWHAQDVTGNPALVSRELQDSIVRLEIPVSRDELVARIRPSIPWAEDHFGERVGGQPLNPAPSEAWWPYAVGGNQAHKEDEQFSHTYPERMWPKRAGVWVNDLHFGRVMYYARGVRYALGDLQDVVEMLKRNPMTRQAFLPIWFPEDTGAVEGQRVPCTIGYHFLVRNNRLSCSYYIRSCDAMRHFRDDLYMAARLMQWMCLAVNPAMTMGHYIRPGHLNMYIASFHVFEGDMATLKTKGF